MYGVSKSTPIIKPVTQLEVARGPATPLAGFRDRDHFITAIDNPRGGLAFLLSGAATHGKP